MMNDIAKMQELWQEMSSWMTTYMKSFYSPEAAKTAKSHLEIKSAKTIFFDDAQIVDGIILKEKHTWKVVKNCENLAKHLNLNEHDSLLAKMIGLFHDVGRFYQFTVYRTFNDALSENHAKLGLKVIKDLPFMAKLDEEDLATLKFAIGNHNAKEIAPTENQRHLAFAKLIRDADKIDIYRVLKPFLGCEFMLALHVVMLVVGILFITNFKLKKPKNVTMGAIVAVVAMAVIAILVRHYMRYMSMM